MKIEDMTDCAVMDFPQAFSVFGDRLIKSIKIRDRQTYLCLVSITLRESGAVFNNFRQC